MILWRIVPSWKWIILLLEICLNATFLQFQEICYQQKQGTAIGSPVSVTVANLVMEDAEQRALTCFQSEKPLFWKRYAHGTCTAIHLDFVDEFHQHINDVEPSIQRSSRTNNYHFWISY